MRNFRFFPSFTGQKMIKKFQIIIKVPSERAHFFTPCRMNFEIICNRSIFSKFLRKYPYSYLLIPGVILVDTMFFGMLSRVYPCQTVCDIQYVRCLNIKNRFFWLWFLAEPPKSQSGKLSSPHNNLTWFLRCLVTWAWRDSSQNSTCIYYTYQTYTFTGNKLCRATLARCTAKY